MTLFVFVYFFGLCYAQNVTLSGLQRAIPNCSRVNQEFVNSWNSIIGEKKGSLCRQFYDDQSDTNDCGDSSVGRCYRFERHRDKVEKFVDFVFGRISKIRGVTPELNKKLRSIFWEMDRRQDNKFMRTWESFKNESSLVDVNPEDIPQLIKRFDDEFWAFEEIKQLRWWDYKEFPFGHSFPYETKYDENGFLDWSVFEEYPRKDDH